MKYRIVEANQRFEIETFDEDLNAWTYMDNRTTKMLAVAYVKQAKKLETN